MRNVLKQMFAKPSDTPDDVACELADARSRNANSAKALDKTIERLLEANRREPHRSH